MEVIKNIATVLQCTEQTGLSVYVLLLAAAIKPMASWITGTFLFSFGLLKGYVAYYSLSCYHTKLTRIFDFFFFLPVNFIHL